MRRSHETLLKILGCAFVVVAVMCVVFALIIANVNGEDGTDGIDGVNGIDGADGADGTDGVGIDNISKTTDGSADTYTITYTNGETYAFSVTNGEDGVYIDTIEKTATSGNVDTYTITLTDGSTQTFEVTNGTDGQDGDKGDTGDTGDKGDKGDTGAQGVGISNITVYNGYIYFVLSDSTLNTAGTIPDSSGNNYAYSFFLYCSTHNWSVSSTTAATCTSTGVTYYVCDTCGAIKTEILAMTDHTYDTANKILISDNGYEEVYAVKCSGCSEYHIMDKTSLAFTAYTAGGSLVSTQVSSSGNSASLAGARLTSGSISYYTVSRGTYLGANPVIPSTYNGYPVYVVDDFRDSSYTTTDEIMVGTQTVSFAYSELESITIGSNVTTINEEAFCYCKSLETITFAGTSNLSTIGNNAFESCYKLTSITLPDTVTSIGAYAFYECYALEEVDISTSSLLATIGEGAFGYCESLKRFVVTSNVSSIGDYAFEGCYKLVEVCNYSLLDLDDYSDSYITDYAKTIITSSANAGTFISQDGYEFYKDYNGDYYLIGYTGSEVNLTLPTTVGGVSVDYEIIDYALSGLYNIVSVVIPSNVTSIGEGAFEDCYRLIEICNNSDASIDDSYADPLNTYSDSDGDSILITSVEDYIFFEYESEYYLIAYTGTETDISLPDNVNGNSYSIYSYAFYNNSSITSITIPSSITTIGYSAFEGCTSLERVYYGGTVSQWASILFDNAYANPLYYGSLYLNEVLTTSIDLSGATAISDYAFYHYTSLTSIEIPSTVTSMGTYVFANCTSLASANINMTGATGTYLFYNCTGLTSVTIGSNVTSIGNYAFRYCTSLTSIEIPSTVTSMGNHVFANCTSLASANINMTGATGTYLFYNCTGLTSVTIGNNVTIISNYAFQYCTSLTNVTIGSGVQYIQMNAFEGCTSLVNIIIPNNITAIVSNAFDGCTSLISIIIGSGMTSIGSDAFANTSLTYVYYYGTADDWSEINTNTNTKLSSATIYYYSAEAPASAGDYWYYDGNGDIAIWP